jgi:hypothetical protein
MSLLMSTKRVRKSESGRHLAILFGSAALEEEKDLAPYVDIRALVSVHGSDNGQLQR